MISPRILVVQSVVILPEEGKRFLDLALLTREASKEFPHFFPPEAPRDPSKVMDYAGRHFTPYLMPCSSSLSHPTRHADPERKYSLGSVLTEREAFELGDVEPHIDTICADMALIAKQTATKGKLEGPIHWDAFGETAITQALQEANYLAEGQIAILRHNACGYMELDVRSLDNARRFQGRFGDGIGGIIQLC
ncbi:MAG: hypothetical protein AABX70_03175 [Nanoarchaeota archaeon]